jgi:hypothetical protein
MRKQNMLICAAIAIGMTAQYAKAAVATGDHWDFDSRYSVKEEQTIKNTFTLATGKRSVQVDNVFGSIEVVGTSGDQVQMTVTETYRGETQDKIVQAKKEVSLDTSNENGELKLYVNGPFRCQCNDDDWGSRRHAGYIVKMDFKLEVPANVDVTLTTVNDGNIKMSGVTGDFRVHNVNGSVDINDAAGSGKALTVNGHVSVSFRQNPKTDSSFGSVNGEVVLKFAQNLSADFRFKNMNGGVYSDFDLAALPPKQATEERGKGHYVYRSDRFTGGRVGNGGPEIKVENLNGAIRILQRQA